MTVMTTRATVRTTRSGTSTPMLMIQSERGPEKLSAAKALPSCPASVMATWIVERNLAGCSVNV